MQDQKTFAIRCPSCGLLLQAIKSRADYPKKVYCYSCDKDVTISADDVEEAKRKDEKND